MLSARYPDAERMSAAFERRQFALRVGNLENLPYENLPLVGVLFRVLS